MVMVRVYQLTAVIAMLMANNAISATSYLGPKVIIRAVRKRYNKKINKRGNIEIMLTIGKPNYAERKFIKLCKKAGEKFPVKKIQLKFKKGSKND